LNECISKGSIIYKDDADKFGFDKRFLSDTDWFNFIIESGKKINSMMGINVTLSPILTGIEFRK